MKQLLLTTIAAVLVVGCGQGPEIPLIDAVRIGNLKAVKRAVKNGQDVNAELGMFGTPPYTQQATLKLPNFLLQTERMLIEKTKEVSRLCFMRPGMF